MTKTMLDNIQHVIQAAVIAAMLFAASFAYSSNAKLAVIESKLDTGLSELRECRALADSHSVDIALLQEYVREVRRKGG